MIKSHVLYRLSYGLGAPLLTEKRGALPALRAPLEQGGHRRMVSALLEHDPQKRKPFLGKDHAQTLRACPGKAETGFPKRT
jgi:hypothetical protein